MWFKSCFDVLNQGGCWTIAQCFTYRTQRKKTCICECTKNKCRMTQAKSKKKKKKNAIKKSRVTKKMKWFWWIESYDRFMSDKGVDILLCFFSLSFYFEWSLSPFFVAFLHIWKHRSHTEHWVKGKNLTTCFLRWIRCGWRRVNAKWRIQSSKSIGSSHKARTYHKLKDSRAMRWRLAC